MSTAQVATGPHPAPTDGLRSRKKVKTRLAIEDAALELFERQGYEATTVEEIAAEAEVSTTTFFRYFPSKAEVVLSDHGQQLPGLHQAILERPARESDLDAIRHAIQHEWVAVIDAARTARKAQIIATSDLLRGLSFHRGHRWLSVFTDALAQRNGLDPQDERCSLAARVSLAAHGSAVERWISSGCIGDLGGAVDQSFDAMAAVCADVSRRKPASRRGAE